ncbi:hypothetical protein CMI37_13500 [Candidatus Pacearchaeota archaeon]|nr:hypothetical protein [Candidatus Pacearchaeota archaeon]|tara:strand:+ start:1836 stop:2060 length:225 start_codon:yes stop_codon:yes gene_type:complete
MKAYLCIENDKEVIEVSNLPKSEKERKTLYFVMKAESWKEAAEEAKGMGARIIRVLTEEEAVTETKNGSYDIEL